MKSINPPGTPGVTGGGQAVGQTARDRLKKAVAQGRAVHAYLLTGGALAQLRELALFLAQALVCERRPEGPCGECLACRKAAAGNHADVHWTAPTGASLKLQQVQALQDQAWLSPTQSAGKVFILEQADIMTTEAANSLLRILEDPPGAATFILLTEQSQQLLPTILSRCQRLDMAALEALPEEALRTEARSLVEQLPSMDELRILDLAEEWDRERNRLQGRVAALAACFRDLLVIRQTGDRELAFWKPDLPWLEEQAPRHTISGLVAGLEACEACLRHLERNVNARLATEVLLFELRNA